MSTWWPQPILKDNDSSRVTEWVEAVGSPLDITRRNPVEKYLCIVHYRDYLTGSAPGSMKNIFTNLLYLRLLGNEVKERKFSSCSCCIMMIYNNNNKILAVDVYCNKWTAIMPRRSSFLFADKKWTKFTYCKTELRNVFICVFLIYIKRSGISPHCKSAVVIYRHFSYIVYNSGGNGTNCAFLFVPN